MAALCISVLLTDRGSYELVAVFVFLIGSQVHLTCPPDELLQLGLAFLPPLLVKTRVLVDRLVRVPVDRNTLVSAIGVDEIDELLPKRIESKDEGVAYNDQERLCSRDCD